MEGNNDAAKLSQDFHNSLQSSFWSVQNLTGANKLADKKYTNNVFSGFMNKNCRAERRRFRPPRPRSDDFVLCHCRECFRFLPSKSYSAYCSRKCLELLLLLFSWNYCYILL
jgi:hypothetical protein